MHAGGTMGTWHAAVRGKYLAEAIGDGTVHFIFHRPRKAVPARKDDRRRLIRAPSPRCVFAFTPGRLKVASSGHGRADIASSNEFGSTCAARGRTRRSAFWHRAGFIAVRSSTAAGDHTRVKKRSTRPWCLSRLWAGAQPRPQECARISGTVRTFSYEVTSLSKRRCAHRPS